jgi:tetratricopeptide (TPR) repeat protein
MIMLKRAIQILVPFAAFLALLVAQQKGPVQTAPKGKGISKKEAEAINKIASGKTPDERIAAAEELISNFADTEYKDWAMQAAAEAAEQKNDFAKAIFYAERALEANPKYIESLILWSRETAAHTRENDLDKDDKLAKVDKNAKLALELIPAEPKPATVKATDAQWDAYKKDETAQAHVALGLSAMVRKKYDDAAKEYQTAVDNEPMPDPTHLIRLANAYNEAGKPDEALATADKLLAMADLPQQYKNFAQQEKARAEKAKSGKK